MTDEMAAYKILDGTYSRHAVNHAAGQYVKHFFCHINSIEGAWSLFKRQVFGIHHWVSGKHLQRYLDEMCFRYNRRKFDESVRFDDFLSRTDGRLTYEASIS